MRLYSPFQSLAIISFVIFTVCGVISASPRPPYPELTRSLNARTRSNTDALEEELNELKDLPRDDSWIIHPTPHNTRVGQPELTNEDLEEELTEVRPLDMPLQMLEVDDDGETLHYVTSTPRTLARPHSVVDETYPYHDSAERDDDAQHSGDSSTTPATSTEPDNNDDDDDDGDDDYGEGDDDDDSDEEEEGSDADESDGNREKGSKDDGEISMGEERTNIKKPTTIQNRGEDHRLQPTPSGESAEDRVGTVAMSNGAAEMTTRRPATLMGDLEKFLGLTALPSERPQEHHEAELDSGTRLEQVRELQKKADIPQNLVDAVNPKADEGLLELMVRIAEDPAEWHRVHLQLQQLDEDLASSRNTVEKIKAWEDANDATNLHDIQPQKPLLSDDLHSSEDELQVSDSTSSQNKRESTLQEEQQRVATMDDEVEGALSLMKQNKTDKPRPVSAEEEVEMVSGIDDGHEKALKRTDDNFYPPRKAKHILNNEWEDKKKKQKHKNKSKGNKILKGESDQRREMLEKAGVLTPLEYTDKHTSGNNHSKDKSKSFKGSDKIGSKISSYTTKNGTKNKSSKLKSQTTTEPSTTAKPREPVHGKLATDNSNSQKNGSPKSGIASLRKHLGSITKEGGESKLQKVRNRLKIDKQREENGNADVKEVAPINETKPLIMKLSRYRSSRNNTPPWLAITPQNYRMPSKEERSGTQTPYYSDVTSYVQSREQWPDFSLDSMKHGGNVNRQWPSITNMMHQNENQKMRSKINSKPTTNDVLNKWPAFPPEFADEKDNNIDPNTWPDFSSYHYGKSFSDRLSNAWSQKETGTHRTSVNKQWPHFAYHRVTSSPQVLAQQRARHRNAYVAVSVVAPPSRSKSFNKTPSSSTAANISSDNITANKSEQPSSKPLQDKMDMLLAMRSEQRTADPLEEELVDTAASTSRTSLPWSHARHLDKIQEQLKTLSAMEEKLRYHWLEKERLRQILRDGGQSGAGFYRAPRDGSRENAVTTTNPATNPSPSMSEPGKRRGAQ